MRDRRAVIIGAGFTGLTAAYYLNQKGFKVDVYERSKEPGGLIHTVETKWGAVETAANGILNSKLFEDLARDIDLSIQAPKKEARRRFIFRGRPRQWPLTPVETTAMLTKLAVSVKRAPRPKETIAQWGRRVLGPTATEFVLSPALQGIYAGDVERMSASLILGRFFKKRGKKERPSVRGTVAPVGGMGVLMERLTSKLVERGVGIHFGESRQLEIPSGENFPFQIVCASASGAADLVGKIDAELGRALRGVEMMGLIKATVFFTNGEPPVRGFGCLFPRNQGFRALGVLFNHDIFPGMTEHESETWILGGAGDGEVLNLTDMELLALVLKEHEKIHESREARGPLGFHVQRWPSALPHYTTELENILATQQDLIMQLEKKGIVLMGNYLGGVGLSQILERSANLPERLVFG